MHFLSLYQDSHTELVDEIGYLRTDPSWYDGAPDFQRSWIDDALQRLSMMPSLEFHPRICIQTPDIRREITVFRSGRVELDGSSFSPGFDIEALWRQMNLTEASELLWRFVVDGPTQIEHLGWKRGACSICYVCGADLKSPPWGHDGKSSTYDLCPCCNCFFGLRHHWKSEVQGQREWWLKQLGFEPQMNDFGVLPQLRNLPTDYSHGWYDRDEEF